MSLKPTRLAILKAVQITRILGNLFFCNVCLARLLTSDMDELTCSIEVFCSQIMLRCNAASLPQYTLYGLGQRQLFSGNTLGMLHNALLCEHCGSLLSNADEGMTH